MYFSMVLLTQKEHRSTQEWFSALVRHSSDLIIVLDEEGLVAELEPKPPRLLLESPPRMPSEPLVCLTFTPMIALVSSPGLAN